MKALRTMVWWIVVGILLVVAIQLWVLWAQKWMSFFPTSTRANLAGGEAFGICELEIPTTDGQKLVCWWRPPDDGRATILYFGGNAGTVADRRIFLEALTGSGYGILAVNYRGYGGSTGSPSEKGIYLDGLSAFDYLTDTLSVEPRTVIAYGQSLGGTVATKVAAERPVGGMVLESTFTSADAMARRVIPVLPLWLLMTYKFDNIGRVGRIACPKLIVHGNNDETVPFTQGEKLFAAAAEPKRFYPVNKATHNDIFETGGITYLESLQEFIDSCLTGDLWPAP